MGYNGGQVSKKHLEFIQLFLKKGKKMIEYKVWNKTLNQGIGIIRWRGGWRQYVFQAFPEVDMTRSCNLEVNEWIDKLMKLWREELKSKQTETRKQ